MKSNCCRRTFFLTSFFGMTALENRVLENKVIWWKWNVIAGQFKDLFTASKRLSINDISYTIPSLYILCIGIFFSQGPWSCLRNSCTLMTRAHWVKTNLKCVFSQPIPAYWRLAYIILVFYHWTWHEKKIM